MNTDNLVALDCEVYPNYFLVAFKKVDGGKVVRVHALGLTSLTPDDITKIKNILTKRTTFGFNSRNYDQPILAYALSGASCVDIYKMSCHIIEQGSPGWMTLKHFNLAWPDHYRHFDISEPAPGVRIGLKLYGGRMHSKKLQDLPYDPHMELTHKQAHDVALYCENDLDTTIDLYRATQDQLNLRADMSKQYGIDLMSKSDAQIAEAVIKSRIGGRITKPNVSPTQTYRYTPPPFVSFDSDELRDTLGMIATHDFEIDGKGSIKLPDELGKKIITIGTTNYQLGIGGLHSKESKQIVVPGDNQILADRDVASYYPAIILNLGLYPRHLGKKFLTVYKDIVEERLRAKKAGNKVVADSLKIVVNGSFGKLGSKYSVLYSPDLMMVVTLTGQLSLLMLIESLEANGIKVVSANTDGIVALMDKSDYELYDTLCFDWELTTGFTLEETRYKGLYSRDVNNYFAVTDTGKTKGKGIFTDESLMKNPMHTVCSKAAMVNLIEGVPLDTFIKDHKCFSDFLCVRRVTGGAVWRADYLGKVVRWYYAKGHEGDVIRYAKNGNKVSLSDGARPIMDLPSDRPDDIDFDRYVAEARKIIRSLGTDERV